MDEEKVRELVEKRNREKKLCKISCNQRFDKIHNKNFFHPCMEGKNCNNQNVYDHVLDFSHPDDMEFTFSPEFEDGSSEERTSNRSTEKTIDREEDEEMKIENRSPLVVFEEKIDEEEDKNEDLKKTLLTDIPDKECISYSSETSSKYDQEDERIRLDSDFVPKKVEVDENYVEDLKSEEERPIVEQFPMCQPSRESEIQTSQDSEEEDYDPVIFDEHPLKNPVIVDTKVRKRQNNQPIIRRTTSNSTHANSKSPTSKNKRALQKIYFFLPSNSRIPFGRPSRDIPIHVPLPFLDPEFEDYWLKVTNKRKNPRNFTELRTFLRITGGQSKNDYRCLELAINKFGSDNFYKRILPMMIIVLRKSEYEFKNNKLRFLRQCQNDKFYYESIGPSRRRRGNIPNDWCLPNINFKKLFNTMEKCALQKILCFLNYFDMVFRKNDDEMTNHYIEFERMHVSPIGPGGRIFKECQSEMGGVVMLKKGSIEDRENTRQMDFANMYIGGGVLGRGAVQEEIRFCINPECIVGMLLCPCLLDTETIIIRGTERFSNYEGYGSKYGTKTFKFAGPHKDLLIGKYEIGVMDALNFGKGGQAFQFRIEGIKRELWKSYVSFKLCRFPGISTGHWGCGSFRGNRGLKFVIQWLSASVNEKKLFYHCFKKKKWMTRFWKFTKVVTEEGYTVAEVYKAVYKLGEVESVDEDILEEKCLDLVLMFLRENRDKKEKKKKN